MTDPRNDAFDSDRDVTLKLDHDDPRLNLQRGKTVAAAEQFDLRDFDIHVDEAQNQVEAAQLALSLTQILGAQHEIKAALQRLDLVSASREKNEAQRAASLAKLVISPAELAEAAHRGAHVGSSAAMAEVSQRVDAAAKAVRTVNERLERDARHQAEERGRWGQWAICAAIGAATAILAGVFSGYMVGEDAGAAKGYAKARDEIAAASWANTDNGAFARQLDREGSLQQIRDCSGQQWRIQKVKGRRVCFAGDAPPGQSLQGWYVP